MFSICPPVAVSKRAVSKRDGLDRMIVSPQYVSVGFDLSILERLADYLFIAACQRELLTQEDVAVAATDTLASVQRTWQLQELSQPVQ